MAEPLAFGAIEVPELARSAADGRKRLTSERSLDESRIQRDGLEPGTKAPNFELDDVRGGKVSLDAYRGRPLLLVLSDPDCGPCNALLPDLARLQDETTIVMVSSGDVAANRAKVEEHARFPSRRPTRAAGLEAVRNLRHPRRLPHRRGRRRRQRSR